MRSEKQIVEEIEKLEKELRSITEYGGLPLNASDFTTEEKVIAFDAIHARAVGQVKYAVENGRDMKDHRYYMYEIAMDSVLGDRVWDILNEVIE